MLESCEKRDFKPAGLSRDGDEGKCPDSGQAVPCTIDSEQARKGVWGAESIGFEAIFVSSRAREAFRAAFPAWLRADMAPWNASGSLKSSKRRDSRGILRSIAPRASRTVAFWSMSTFEARVASRRALGTLAKWRVREGDQGQIPSCVLEISGRSCVYWQKDTFRLQRKTSRKVIHRRTQGETSAHSLTHSVRVRNRRSRGQRTRSPRQAQRWPAEGRGPLLSCFLRVISRRVASRNTDARRRTAMHRHADLHRYQDKLTLESLMGR